jgi:hypothetical protein
MTSASWTLKLGGTASGTLIYNVFTIHSASVLGDFSSVFLHVRVNRQRFQCTASAPYVAVFIYHVVVRYLDSSG